MKNRATVRPLQRGTDRSELGAMEPAAGRVALPSYNGSRREASPSIASQPTLRQAWPRE